MIQMYRIESNVLKGVVRMKYVVSQIFNKKKLIVLVFLFIFIYGIYSYFAIPKQDMPSINTPYMVVTITAPGLSANDIDQSIIDDIEIEILTFSEVSTVRSTIYDNYAIVVIEFYFSIDDPSETSLIIFKELNELNLSDKITDLSYLSDFSDPHIIYALNSDLLLEEDLYNYSVDFKNSLLSIDEIKSVEIESALQKEVNIELNTEMMDLYGINILTVYQILYANSINIPLGGINTSTGFISINGNIVIDDIEALSNIIIIPEIPTISEIVYLKDIAQITLDNSSSKIYEFNGKRTTFLSVYFENDIDFTKMGDEVTDLKEAFLENNNVLDLSVGETLFLPDYVEKQISNVFFSLLICILVVMIVVFIGIGFRNSILIIITIPLIVFSTIGLLNLLGHELHQLTIVGLIISIGILVDNSIVITEGIKRHIDLGYSKVEGAKKAIIENAIPVLTSTLTTIVAFAVLVFLPGFLGEIVSSMPITVIIALSISYIVSIFLSPILATIFMKAPNKDKKKKNTIHEKRIKSMIRNTLKLPILWIVISIVVLILSTFFAFKYQDLDLYPNDGKSVLYIDVENESINDLSSTTNTTKTVINFFKDNPHVLNYSTSIGGDLPRVHFSTPLLDERMNISRIYINLDLNEDDLKSYKIELESNLSTIVGAKITVGNIELSPPIKPLVLTLLSENSTELEMTSDSIYDEIVSLDSVKSYTITENENSEKYNIIYDYGKISSAFISKVEIDQIITMNLNGISLGIFEYNNDLVSVNIYSEIEIIDEILGLLIISQVTGMAYSLEDFIDVEIVQDYNVINKYNNSIASYIELDYSNNSSLTELENDVKSIVDDNISDNTTVIYDGENNMFEEIKSDLISASIFAIVLIYIIMLSQFNNFIKPLIILLTIPLSFSGSFILLIILNGDITATFLIGMVSLIGVTVNTGIILVEYISRIHKENDDILEACVDAVFIRFRPIMLTSMTTILGLIPLLLTGGNFFKPLAISFMGGMITSTFFTIFIIPSVYYIIYNKPKKKTS